ncbi:uncharacterized protein F4812DRAFT_263489 [Daldinia caldariorum]|uniref:uncharacterized protein n=1 Tax=Daldinia caldariorum TaxID=326644 RepID=UPI002008DF41|nr:uncharacterized protein F4812DRAFT_263489 [Daldinia caldariorum]KAI1470383.1 hypothetical protein F4812DRAFT_263489 [Daldinia caldariorum]
MMNPLTQSLTLLAAQWSLVQSALTRYPPNAAQYVIASPESNPVDTCDGDRDSLGDNDAYHTPTIVPVKAWGSEEPSATPLPVWPTWPMYGQIIPIETTVAKPAPTDNGVLVPCTAWFFSVCISWGDIHIGSWYWDLPPGIYEPGPVPTDVVKWPSGVDIQGTLPNWPRITIGEDKQITTDSAHECKAQTAAACTITTQVSAGKTLSVTNCAAISGCAISVPTTPAEVVGDQTAAPVGTWYDEAWPTTTLGTAYTNSVLEALSRDLESDKGSAMRFMPEPTAGPTYGDEL